MFFALQRQTCKEVHEMFIEINECCKNCNKKPHIAILCSKLECTSTCLVLDMKMKDKIGNILQLLGADMQ